MTDRYIVRAHLPRNSADAEYQIVDTYADNVVALVDPQMVYATPQEVAEQIARAMNTCRVMDD